MEPQAQKTSGVAIASLVTSLLGIGLAGVICGHVALSKIKKAAGTLGGKGLAIAGLVIGYLQIVAFVFIVIPMLFVAAFAYKRSAAEPSPTIEWSAPQAPERMPTIPDQQ